jgi:glycosyltransferase involved in cell wall biosynthesis
VRVLSVGNRYPPWSVGGYEATWAANVAQLRAAGHTVRVLTTRPDPTDQPAPGGPGDLPDDVHRELAWYWRAHTFTRPGLADTIRLERANAAVLCRQLRSFAPDVVMWWAMGGMSLSLLEQVRRAGVPAVGVVGDDWLAYGPQVDAWSRRFIGLGRLAARPAERLTGLPARLSPDRAARWSMNSRHTLEAARAAAGPFAVAATAHPGVDPERFAPARAREEWTWRLLYCGRIDPRKGIATAVRALASLPAQAILRIHGDGDERHRDELVQLARRLDVADRVVFSGSDHAHVPDAYAACDALVFPVTWQEPWGLVPLEAMAVGRPVIASRAGGGPAEYLADGGNCLQFAPDDAAGLADAAGRLAHDEGLRNALVAAGSRTAARFTEQAFHASLTREAELAIAQGPLG